MTDPIRSRLSELEARAKAIDGDFAMVHLFASKYGWKASCSITAIQRCLPDEYFPTAGEALDFFERTITAYEDRDGALARTLGVGVVA